jgi:hypothetical protein
MRPLSWLRQTCEYRKDSRIFVFLINKAMNVVSKKEFNANQEKYFEQAINEHVYVRNGDYTFAVTLVNYSKKKKYLTPDDDLRGAITMNELRESVHAHIDKLFAEK